jgi:hypothetical protein
MKQWKWQVLTQIHLSTITPLDSGHIFNITKCTTVKKKHVASLHSNAEGQTTGAVVKRGTSLYVIRTGYPITYDMKRSYRLSLCGSVLLEGPGLDLEPSGLCEENVYLPLQRHGFKSTRCTPGYRWSLHKSRDVKLGHILLEEHRLKKYENTVLRRLFGS